MEGSTKAKHVQNTSDQLFAGTNSTQAQSQGQGSSDVQNKSAESGADPDYEEFPGVGVVEVPEEFITDSTFRERLSRKGAPSWAYTDDPKTLMQLVEK